MSTEPPPADAAQAVPEHAIACRWCNAQPGSRCTTRRGRPLPILSHDMRITDWAERTNPEGEHDMTDITEHGDDLYDPDRADPYANSPDVGDDTACNCNGAWHARQQHCVDWPCPGCTRICPPEPGTGGDDDTDRPMPCGESDCPRDDDGQLL